MGRLPRTAAQRRPGDVNMESKGRCGSISISAIQRLGHDAPDHPSAVQLTAVYHNLLRQSADLRRDSEPFCSGHICSQA